jgi:hypothetical protein
METRIAALGLQAAVLLCYSAVALFFWWPLPLHLADALPGPASGDTGVYVWNLWLFRHEIVTHQSFPFETLEILNAGSGGAVPLAQHNYTPFAGALALPLIGLIGLIPTFNVLVIGNGVLTAYAMFLYARRRTGDAGAAFAGGLLFGFSPFMMVRSSEHFSLAQAAPLPIFGLLMLELFQRPGLKVGALAGLTVAWAYMSDPYYAVYCVLIALFTVGYSLVAVEQRPSEVRRVWWPNVLTLLILCTGGFILGVLLSGGGRLEVFGLSLSVRRLYTPVLLLTLLLAIRVWITLHKRLTWQMPFRRAHISAAGFTVVICALALMPVLYAMASPRNGATWTAPRVWWRSSAMGVDLAAWLVPNPLHPWFGSIWTNGYVENIASIPWTALALVVAAWAFAGFKGTRGWWCFLILFGLLSMGPFVHIAGMNTYVPTPWALLRYVPIIGAARMPTRMTILVMMAVAMLAAMALAQLRERSRYRHLLLTAAVTLLIFELMPAPRQLFPAAVPQVTRMIAADPRAIRVLNLPFGIKDGLGSRGGFSTAYQYYQTAHEKPLTGGYLSRLPPGTFARYRENPALEALLRLSEHQDVDDATLDAAVPYAHQFVTDARLAYVLVDMELASEVMIRFAERAFRLRLVAEESGFALYETTFAE